MRVCLVSREFAPFHGWGAGTYASLMAQAMSREGHEVHVLFADPLCVDEASANRPGVTFHAVDLGDDWSRLPAFDAEPQRYAYAVYRRLLTLHEHHRFEYIEFPDFLGEAYFALRGKRTLGRFEGALLGLRLHMTVRQIRAINADDWIDIERATVEHMESWSLAHADLLTAPCPQMAEHVRGVLTSAGGGGGAVPPLRMIEYPFDVDLQRRELGWEGPPDERSRTREVVFAGRFERRKGVHVLLDAAIALLREREFADVTFRFVGEDTQTAPLGGSMLEWMHGRIRDARLPGGLHERIRFDARAPRHALSALYSGCACVCLPSLWENFPFACLEAMALGAPVIGGDAGGMSHLIEHGESGLLARSGCAFSLAEQLRAMLRDPSLRSRCAMRAPERVRTLCDPSRVARDVVDWISSVRASRRQGHARRIVTAPCAPPQVSVIVPVYNTHEHLHDALASVRGQSLAHVETIVIDDGSTRPDTIAALDALERAADGASLRVIRAGHGGLSHARNIGVHEARGDYIFPLDSDDMLHPRMLETCLRVFHAHDNVGFVTAFLRHFIETPDRPVGGWIPLGGDLDCMGVMNGASNAAAMMPRRLVLDAGGYDTDLCAYEDWDLFAGILERGYRGEVIPEFWILYRRRAGSMMHTLDRRRHHLLRARLLAKHPTLALNASRLARFMLGASVNIYELGHPHEPTEDSRVFRRAQELLHQNLRYKAADRLNDAMHRMGVQRAIKRLVNGHE